MPMRRAEREARKALRAERKGQLGGKPQHHRHGW